MEDPWGGRRAGFTARTVIRRTDFKVGGEGRLKSGGWMIGEEVEITLEIEGIERKEGRD